MYDTSAITLASPTWEQMPKKELAEQAQMLARTNAGLRQELAAVENFAASKIPLKAHPVLTSGLGISMGAIHGVLEAWLAEWGMVASGVMVGAEALGAILVTDPSWRAILVASATGKASGAAAIHAKERLKVWLEARKNGTAASGAPKV
jgi:hypothetical protein